jgi:hypothetical protein
MNHPYKEYQGTALWEKLDQLLKHLEANGDIEICASRELLIGYLSKGLSGTDEELLK